MSSLVALTSKWNPCRDIISEWYFKCCNKKDKEKPLVDILSKNMMTLIYKIFTGACLRATLSKTLQWNQIKFSYKRNVVTLANTRKPQHVWGLLLQENILNLNSRQHINKKNRVISSSEHRGVDGQWIIIQTGNIIHSQANWHYLKLHQFIIEIFLKKNFDCSIDDADNVIWTMAASEKKVFCCKKHWAQFGRYHRGKMNAPCHCPSSSVFTTCKSFVDTK